MELTEKENAILSVLQRRVDCCEKAIIAHKREIERRQKEIEYLLAKLEGYHQAAALIKNPIESIKVEL